MIVLVASSCLGSSLTACVDEAGLLFLLDLSLLKTLLILFTYLPNPLRRSSCVPDGPAAADDDMLVLINLVLFRCLELFPAVATMGRGRVGY